MPGRLIALLLALSVVSTMAKADEEAAYLAGLGTMTCAQFTDRVRQDAELAETVQFIWAQGFMSASNVWRAIFKERLRNLDAWAESDQRVHLRLFCHQHPDAFFGAAVQDLYAALPIVSTPSEVVEQQQQLGRH